MIYKILILFFLFSYISAESFLDKLVSDALDDIGIHCQHGPNCDHPGLNDTCFPHIGCFSNKAPWHSLTRPAKPPKPPEDVCTSAVLYTRYVHNLTLTIYPHVATEWRTYFNPMWDTTVISHGMLRSAYAPYLHNMSYAILNRSDHNVILIDWSKGSCKSILEYFQAISNIRVVGAVTARFINHLVVRLGADLSRFHLMGHSLGAHSMAYAAKDLDGKVGWLTGLDPSGPWFNGYPDEIRMRPSDALFTDAIHTDVDGEGEVSADGHCNFYMNIGTVQPECRFPNQKNPLILNCSHEAVHVFYQTAIQFPYCFLGVPISFRTIAEAAVKSLTFDTLQEVYTNTTCREDNLTCVPLGFETIRFKETCLNQLPMKMHSKPNYGNTNRCGNYVIFTDSRYPYCLNRN